MSQMTRSGMGAAMSATTSIAPSFACAVTRARASTSATIVRTESSVRSSIRGVKVFETILRILACRGSSMLISEP